MPSDNSKSVYYRGEFKYHDALTKKEVEALGKLVSSIIGATNDKSVIPNLVTNARLKKSDGIHAKFYDWNIGVAYEKAEGAASPVQKINPTTMDVTLKQWEVKVGITDEAALTGNMTAGDVLTAAQQGKAFARAIDADGFKTMLTEAAAGTNVDWTAATDDEVIDSITNAVVNLTDAGYDAEYMILTPKQRGRLMKITNGLANPTPLETYVDRQFGLKLLPYNKITYKAEDGSVKALFDPGTKLMIGDPKMTTIFGQLPFTTEAYRDVERGVNLALVRKFFKTKVLYPEGLIKMDVSL